MGQLPIFNLHGSNKARIASLNLSVTCSMEFTRKLRNLLRQRQTRKFLNRNERPYLQLNAEEEPVRDYSAAGSVFTDGKLILAGYQPRKRKPFISGIGGKKEVGETYMQTAIRETVEELFEFKTISAALIEEIKQTVKPQRVLQNDNYVFGVYTFADLEAMLKIISRYELKTELYDIFPLSLMDLVFKRKLISKPEISHLCILPLVKHTKSNPFVNAYFVEDMPILMK